jgi:hypothetical protein
MGRHEIWIMDTVLAIAAVMVAVDVMAMALAMALALIAAPIFGVAYCAPRWKRRAALLVTPTAERPVALALPLRSRRVQGS